MRSSSGVSSAVILAGGGSKRMGKDKALLRVAGTTFVERIAATIAPLFPEILLSVGANRDIGKYLEKAQVVEDHYPDAGPLAGIHAALSHIESSHLFVISCDMPLVTAAIVDEVLANMVSDRITIAADHRRRHPLLGVYPRSLLPRLEKYLEQGRRRVFSFLCEVGYAPVVFTDICLYNVNTPEDYQAINGS